MFENFIGNKKTLVQIDNWFRDRYSKRIVIEGSAGNGKTFLVELFAEKYGYSLQRIDPYDIRNLKDFNDMLKTLNLIPIESNQKKKLVLIENLNEFHKTYRTKLFEIYNVCKYPIVYTGTKINIPDKYKNKIEVFRINKPVPTDIFKFLKQKIQELNVDIDDEILDKISKQSPSVRSALNSLYNSSPNDITNPIPTFYEQLNAIKYQLLKEDVSRKLLHYVFGNIVDYPTMTKLANYDIELGRKFKTTIDKYMFNNMDFNFISNEYPQFMNQYIDDNDIKQYLYYLKDLHVSKRIFRREFLELIKLLEEGGEEQESIKKIKSIKKRQNILDFV